jgi:hypothetical protein
MTRAPMWRMQVCEHHTGVMDPRLVTVTIRDDAPRTDGTWIAVDTWGREVVVTLADDSPTNLRRGQSLRGVESVPGVVVDAGL